MTEFDPLDLEAYRFWAAEHVRFADLDMLGHVNNKAYATYFETGRVGYFAARGLSDGPRVGMAMVRLEIDYRKEIRFPAALRVGVRPLKLTRSTLSLACAIFNDDVCASTSVSTAVRFDPNARKSTPFSDAERAALEADL
jgi:acyl-CoA thioester hydrolase